MRTHFAASTTEEVGIELTRVIVAHLRGSRSALQRAILRDLRDTPRLERPGVHTPRLVLDPDIKDRLACRMYVVAARGERTLQVLAFFVGPRGVWYASQVSLDRVASGDPWDTQVGSARSLVDEAARRALVAIVD